VIEPDGRVKEYGGGYDDYLRQRQAETPAQSSPSPSSRTTTAPAERPRRLGFKEKRELEALPGRIEGLEAAREDLHREMADPAFYRKDAGAIVETRARLESLEAELAAAYERWEELEGLDGGS
jgi:ATP-binding cassette subfamily F protein uup